MKNYCPDLFQNLFIQKTNANQVELGFCCVSKLSPPLNKIDFDNDYLENQRKKYLETNTLPESCSQCVQDELANSTSRRLQQLEHYGNHNFSTKKNLKWLQYNCDNICNLKCIACSSYYSSAWIEDEKLLGRNINLRIKPTKHNDLLFEFELENISQVYFNGGEPLLTKDHIRVLEYIEKNVDSKKIHVLYNTNATLQLSNEIINLWDKFARVTLMASIDAIDEPFEYIRYPANWNQVKKNLQHYSDHTCLNIGANIGIHNIMYFSDLYNFSLDHKIQFNFQSDTQGFLSLKNAPAHLKEKIIKNLEQAEESNTKKILLNTLSNSTIPNLSWINYLNRLDKIRNNSWKKSLDRLYNLDRQFFDEY